MPETPERNELTLSRDELAAIREYLYRQTGIALAESKGDMVFSRLSKRLRALGMWSFGDYLRCAAADEPPGERQEFINALTTNKTDFFREPHHFEMLRDEVIPHFTSIGQRKLRVWCAASSTGEEPYTLAMTFRDHAPAEDGWDVKILASDIDTKVLEAARRGVYAFDRARDLPADLLRRHFLKGSGANADKVAVQPELKELLSFRQVNLIDNTWPFRHQFDVIFCRNVVIYFDRPTQKKLLERFAAQLNPNGFLFMGHSENIHWASDLFTPIGGTAYRPAGAVSKPRDNPAPRSISLSDTPPPPRLPTKPKPPASKEPEFNIILGDVKATKEPATIKTLLGSCVAACLWDPKTGIGGMNHFSLPGASDEGANARYGAYAMELLITAILKSGGERDRLQAKVFGGGRVLDMGSPRLNVGERNAAYVVKFLEDESIPIVGQDLGGSRGRVVKFRPHTGQALVRPLPGRELPPVLTQEEQFDADLIRKVEPPKTQSPADDADGITLF